MFEGVKQRSTAGTKTAPALHALLVAQSWQSPGRRAGGCSLPGLAWRPHTPQPHRGWRAREGCHSHPGCGCAERLSTPANDYLKQRRTKAAVGSAICCWQGASPPHPICLWVRWVVQLLPAPRLCPVTSAAWLLLQSTAWPHRLCFPVNEPNGWAVCPGLPAICC